MKSSVVWVLSITALVFKPGFCSDDWIGLQADTAWTAGVRVNQYESGDHDRALYFFSTLPRSAYINFQISQSTLEDNGDTFDSDDYLVRTGWSVTDEMDLGLGYQYQGKSRELEIEQYALQLDWSPFPAFFSLQVSRGDVYLFTRDITPPIEDIRNRVQSDMHSYAFGAGYWFDSFSLSARSQRYDYERDLTALNTNRVVQFLLQPGALAQTGLLIAEQSSLTLDYPLDKRDLAWHVLISRSALDNSETRALQFDWIEQLNRHSSLYLSLNRSDEDQDRWSFGVGLEWNS